MMNQNETKLILIIAAAFILSSCGNTKSAEGTTTSDVLSSSTLLLASCNKASSTDMALSSSVLTDQAGQINLNFTKVKFSYLSATVTASGNVIQFYKGKSVNGVLTLDPNPLSIYPYNLSTGAMTGSTSTQFKTSDINTATGFYVALNDPQAQFIKAIVYNSTTGAPVARLNSLIPQFSAKISDYSTDHTSDLQALHPLISTSTSGWSEAQYSSYYQAFCF